MKIVSYFEQQNRPAVICLGRFDGLHIGHKKLVDEAKRLKTILCKESEVCLFYFKQTRAIGRLNAIFTYEEAVLKFREEGIDKIIVAPLDKDFFSISKEDFLSGLKQNFSPVAIVCGEDYTFGMNKSGDVNFLKKFCDANGIILSVVPTVLYDGKKASSTMVKSFLLKGEVSKANTLLGSPYYIIGNVKKGRGDGSKIGFATANIDIDPQKSPLKEGVYKTVTEIDGITYKSVSNYGAAPTFNDTGLKIETHVLGDPGITYGKSITVYFIDYLRDTFKFKSKEQLIKQLQKDIDTL